MSNWAVAKIIYNVRIVGGYNTDCKGRYPNTQIKQHKSKDDHSRVALELVEPGYINACYIQGSDKGSKFIATQGPLRDTVQDFWMMIWEQRSNIIVMLAKCLEAGKRKCEKYWPDEGKVKVHGMFEIKNQEERNFSGFIKRTLTMRNLEEEYENPFTVTQYQFLRWPDHDVPVTTSCLEKMHRQVMETYRSENLRTPIIVHCSAGAGRTGTLIGYDILSETRKAGKKLDFADCVLQMRAQRMEMVQNCDQYILLHKLVLEDSIYDVTDFPSTEIVSQAKKSSQIFREEFAKLDKIKPLKNSTKHGKLEVNLRLNRDRSILPYDRTEVKIRPLSEDSVAPYINASWIETYDNGCPMIAAQGPMESTVECFWRAVVDQNVNTIVMLTDVSKKESSMYWPAKVNGSIEYGRIKVSLVEEEKSGLFVARKITAESQNDQKTINHYQYLDWPATSCPQNASGILELLDKMQESTRLAERGAVLVHCSNGSGRTGTFCAIVNLIERLKCENRVDVFRTVKDLRDCRPGMVQTLEQYIFCYKVVRDYLSSCNLYANFGIPN